MTNRVPNWLHHICEEDIELLLRSEKGIIREFAQWVSEPRAVEALQAEVTRLARENLRLRTVMMAAYEEIGERWESHCDADGYGPQSLMRHLKDGTGYYAGMVEKIKKVNDAND